MRLKDAKLFRQQTYVDGARMDVDNGQTIKVDNPATGKIVGSAPKVGTTEIRHAIEAVDKALSAWRVLTARERTNKSHCWFDLMVGNQDDLARLVTIEQGKPLAEAKGETAHATPFLERFDEEAKRTYGDTTPDRQPDKRIIVIKQPIGVTTAITPWSFPSTMITRKAGPALAAGCTMVLRPASQTPYSALALVELAGRADIPKGVFSAVTGSADEVGGELTGNPIVRKLIFAGSTEIGRQLMAECTQDTKKVSLELGGNAPFITSDDVDLDAAIKSALTSKYHNNGQTYVCANRLYVQDDVYDTSVDRLKAAVAKLNISNSLEAGVITGSLIDARAMARIEEHIADVVSKGTKVVSGDKLYALDGAFFEPTTLVDVPKSVLMSKDETFGPLAPVFHFKDEAEVTAISNDTESGLASYFYARDLARVFRVTERLEYGTAGINTGLIPSEVASFGGIKTSGLGREGSKHGIEDYPEIKYPCLGGI